MEASRASDLRRGSNFVDRDHDLHQDALIPVMDQTVYINPSDRGSITVDRGSSSRDRGPFDAQLEP